MNPRQKLLTFSLTPSHLSLGTKSPKTFVRCSGPYSVNTMLSSLRETAVGLWCFERGVGGEELVVAHCEEGLGI